jgi:hypothetical protein
VKKGRLDFNRLTLSLLPAKRICACAQYFWTSINAHIIVVKLGWPGPAG